MVASEWLSRGFSSKALTIMNVGESFRLLKVCLLQRLARVGFVGHGRMMSCKVNDTIVVIEIQEDRKRGSKEEIHFTINIGIAVETLCEFEAVSNGLVSKRNPPSPDRCHWRQRLGHLLDARSDLWWSVRDEQSAQVVCDEIASGLTEIALPKVQAIASSEALLSAWQEGRGQGLTEYERRVSLVRLLIAMDRRGEAEAALQDLEAASRGRSWAVSAAYDVKELRKQLG